MVRSRPQCFCEGGYFLNSDRLSCTDIDECTTSFQPVCQDRCKNTPGSFECSCRTGVLLPDKVSCGPGNNAAEESCEVNNGGCQHVSCSLILYRAKLVFRLCNSVPSIS